VLGMRNTDCNRCIFAIECCVAGRDTGTYVPLSNTSVLHVTRQVSIRNTPAQKITLYSSSTHRPSTSQRRRLQTQLDVGGAKMSISNRTVLISSRDLVRRKKKKVEASKHNCRFKLSQTVRRADHQRYHNARSVVSLLAVGLGM
jgi:hypothetical protein